MFKNPNVRMTFLTEFARLGFTVTVIENKYIHCTTFRANNPIGVPQGSVESDHIPTVNQEVMAVSLINIHNDLIKSMYTKSIWCKC